jgi:hypothetical protein
MKILFLDIDGVVNCATTAQRHRGFIGIDPYMALLVDRIIQATGCKVVLSSTWRMGEESREEVKRQVTDFIDTTDYSWFDQKTNKHSTRGDEIQKWLDLHKDVTKYAILDDDTRILDSQKHNWFQTYWETGLNEELANKVIKHLND